MGYKLFCDNVRPQFIPNQTFIMKHRPIALGWTLKNLNRYVYMYQSRP